MIFKKNQLALAVAIAAGVALPTSAFATTGYFSHGYGTKSKALAGAGVALSQDAMAAATNPAGMVNVGDRLDVGLALFSPIREYTVTGAGGAPFPLGEGTVESDNELFFIPHFGYNKMLDADSSIGVTVYGNGGMNTKYLSEDTPGGMGTFGAGTAGVDLSQLFVAGTYARKLTPAVSVGVSPILVYQRFKAYGVGSFAGFSSDSANLSDNGYDDSFGYGARLGVQGEVIPGLTLGASYQTKMEMEEFDKYKGLFAEQGDFDIPSTWTIGAAFKINPQNVVTFDIQEIKYTDVNSVSNPFLPNLMTSPLGSDNGAGFGWEDIMIYKLGYQFAMSPTMTWRVGYSQNDQPIPSSEVLFNILAPGVIEQHYTAGFTWNVNPKSELDVAVMYAPEETVSGANPLSGAPQNIELAMKQWEIEVNWGMKF
jgi:long-chain fatty acid transport protein